MAIVTLLSDFGTRDAYVAAMKGVILQIAPKAVVVDISHDIEPQNILQGAFVLRQAVPWFPNGTIHVAVVDPGVGSNRRILAGRFGGQTVIVPDNGLISFLHHEARLEEMRVVDNRRFMLPQISSTFHGRDIMAPVAAHLANGTALRDLGPATDSAALLELPPCAVDREHKVTGTILYIDRFGNLITNIARSDLTSTYAHRFNVQVYVDGVALGPIRGAYHEAPRGEPLAVVGSADLVEIAVHGGSAKERFRPTASTRVEIA